MSDVTVSLPQLIGHADRALVRTVDGLTVEAYAEASLLPGWTRAHVIAHLALNAEGLERALRSLGAGTPEAMYESDQSRDDDIDALTQADSSEVHDRLLSSTTCFSRALAASHGIDADARFERTPGGPTFAVASIPLMRVREVEIHHADLGVDYSPSDWSAEFATVLLDSMTKRAAYPDPFVARASDLGRSWHYGDGEGGPIVTGNAAPLAWWLTGRGSGEGVACDGGPLPRIEAW